MINKLFGIVNKHSKISKKTYIKIANFQKVDNEELVNKNFFRGKIKN
jgi:hypothetical protein